MRVTACVGYILPRPSRYFGSKYLQAMDPLYEDVVWVNENSSCDSERYLNTCFTTQAEVSVNVSTAVVCVYPRDRLRPTCRLQAL